MFIDLVGAREAGDSVLGWLGGTSPATPALGLGRPAPATRSRPARTGRAHHSVAPVSAGDVRVEAATTASATDTAEPVRHGDGPPMSTTALAAPVPVDRPAPPPPARRLTWVLVGLKVRLIRNRAVSTKNGWFALAMSMVVGAGVAVVGLLVAVTTGASASDHARRVVLVLGPNVLVLAWALLPLGTFGSDETLDPGRLVLLPLRRRPLMRGLLAASFVGVAPLAAMAVTVGVVVAWGGPSVLAIAGPAGVLALLLAVALSRTLTTTLAAALSSRRSRDAAVVIGTLLAVSVQGLRFVSVSISTSLVDRFVDIGRWSPPGLLGEAVLHARDGRWGLAVAELLPAAVLVPVLVVAWGRALERSLTVVTSGSTATRRRRRDDDGIHVALLPRWVPFLRPNALGAVVARDLRYSWRDPRRKSALLFRTILAVGGPIYALVRTTDPSPRLVLVAAGVGYLAVLNSFNQFGLDGGALWSDLAVGGRMRVLLLGKNVSSLVQVIPAVTVAAVILAAATGGWLYVPAAVLLATAAVAVGLGVADVVSVRKPFKIPETRNGFGGGALGSGGGGQGLVTGLALFGATFLQLLLMAPVAVVTAIALAVGPATLLVAVPLAVAYGYGLWRFALNRAVAYGWWREPELLAAVDPGRSG